MEGSEGLTSAKLTSLCIPRTSFNSAAERDAVASVRGNPAEHIQGRPHAPAVGVWCAAHAERGDVCQFCAKFSYAEIRPIVLLQVLNFRS